MLQIFSQIATFADFIRMAKPSGTDRGLSKYARYLKEENRILRARLPHEIRTDRAE